MPATVKVTPGATGYGKVFIGTPGPPAHVKLDLSGLTTNEVDADGRLKPGVPVRSNGTLVGAGQLAYIVVPEPTQLALATVPPTNGTLAAETGDHLVAGPTSGLLNLDVIEDNLGRALTADEIAGLTTTAGSRFQLTTT